jgi:hypothetical protein
LNRWFGKALSQRLEPCRCLSVTGIYAQDLAVALNLLGGPLQQNRQQGPRIGAVRLGFQEHQKINSGSLPVSRIDPVPDCV